MEKEKIWEKSLGMIETSVGRGVFDLWFKPLKIRQLKDGQVVLETPNRFYKEWIEDNYSELISETLRVVSGEEIDVRYRIAEKQDSDYRKISAKITGRRRALRNRGVNINPKYTFEEFVVGPSNQFAHAAAMKVAESPGTVYNPLFVYGGVGLGKTHLISAIGNMVVDRMQDLQVIYVQSENFTNEVVAAIRHEKMTEFKNKYRNVDLLLIDDIQFIAGKPTTQEEFFHTFNALYEQEKQIVVSSDRSPRDIRDITDRLKSRFTMGLIADIQAPSIETKVAILQQKAAYQRIQIPQDVSYWLASRIKSNIRELEGCLLKLAAHSSLTGVPITLEMAKGVLQDFLDEEDRPVTIESIKKAVSEYYGIRLHDIISKKRTKEIAIPRQIAMYLCRELTDLSLNDIGKGFGGKDHATVLYAHKQIEKRKAEDEAFRRIIDSLIKKISE
ncbi:chromosomal replication initiator protein DnaA [bacterium BMS3Bbin06]|nr:chromosomal replication initiator protein DnaA [bacterium BMS3Abin08]GBE33626.1 chromosomal replication initiator protein DnaA [bacterium BMS3Bbin06]HDO35157.1 chromosomal replication initiator protein DnaA [Nitrospirota bacterium]HDY72531.1 chromosomal replication initiator protein DnaA [Nitrospirota bacterium]